MITKSSLLTWFGTPVTEADFEELYRSELPRVYNFFRYRVGDGQLAEDLTSETFEKAWRNRDRYRRNLAAFSTWVFTIARRVAIDHYQIVEVTVRGHSGVWLPETPAPDGNNALVWEENGITYSLISDALSLEEMLQVAESLGE